MKLKIASVILAVFCVSAFAATPAVVNRYVDSFMIEMKSKVNISDQQTTDLANVLYNGINEREDILRKYERKHESLLEKRKMKSELEKVNEHTNSEARNILDDNQYAVFKDIQHENQEKLKKRLQNKK